MAMGKPVITNSGWGDVEEIIAEAHGVIVNVFGEESYKKGVKDLTKMTPYNSSQIRKTAEQHFSLRNGISLYDKIYRELSGY